MSNVIYPLRSKTATCVVASLCRRYALRSSRNDSSQSLRDEPRASAQATCEVDTIGTSFSSADRKTVPKSNPPVALFIDLFLLIYTAQTVACKTPRCRSRHFADNLLWINTTADMSRRAHHRGNVCFSLYIWNKLEDQFFEALLLGESWIRSELCYYYFIWTLDGLPTKWPHYAIPNRMKVYFPSNSRCLKKRTTPLILDLRSRAPGGRTQSDEIAVSAGRNERLRWSLICVRGLQAAGPRATRLRCLPVLLLCIQLAGDSGAHFPSAPRSAWTNHGYWACPLAPREGWVGAIRLGLGFGLGFNISKGGRGGWICAQKPVWIPAPSSPRILWRRTHMASIGWR